MGAPACHGYVGCTPARACALCHALARLATHHCWHPSPSSSKLVEVQGSAQTIVPATADGWQMTLPPTQKVLSTARTFNDLAKATIGAVGRGRIEYVPFPESLRGSYQSFTEADMSALRKAGYTAEFQTIEQAVISGTVFVNNAFDNGERVFVFLVYEADGQAMLSDFEIAGTIGLFVEAEA